MSFSKFKLPHYIFPVYPFAAIMTAKFIENQFIQVPLSIKWKILKHIQTFVITVLWILAFILIYYCFPHGNLPFLIICVVLLAGCQFFLFSNYSQTKIIAATAFTAIGLNFLLNSHVYPELLDYQTSGKAAMIVDKKNVPEGKFYYYRTGASHTMDFYARRIVPSLKNLEILKKKDSVYVYTNERGLKELKRKSGEPFKIVYKGERFYVTKLKIPFLNPKTRDKTTKTHYLLRFD